jgi:hypothetical protein
MFWIHGYLGRGTFFYAGVLEILNRVQDDGCWWFRMGVVGMRGIGCGCKFLPHLNPLPLGEDFKGHSPVSRLTNIVGH